MESDTVGLPAHGRLPHLNRRRLLRIGSLGGLGLTLPGLLRAEGRARAGGSDRLRETVPHRSSIRSCILVFYYGGPSHLDTWDMKPRAPPAGRGPLGAIAAGAPGGGDRGP